MVLTQKVKNVGTVLHLEVDQLKTIGFAYKFQREPQRTAVLRMLTRLSDIWYYLLEVLTSNENDAHLLDASLPNICHQHILCDEDWNCNMWPIDAPRGKQRKFSP